MDDKMMQVKGQPQEPESTVPTVAAAQYGILEARCSCGFLHPVAISKMGEVARCPNKVAVPNPSLMGNFVPSRDDGYPRQMGCTGFNPYAPIKPAQVPRPVDVIGKPDNAKAPSDAKSQGHISDLCSSHVEFPPSDSKGVCNGGTAQTKANEDQHGSSGSPMQVEHLSQQVRALTGAVQTANGQIADLLSEVSVARLERDRLAAELESQQRTSPNKPLPPDLLLLISQRGEVVVDASTIRRLEVQSETAKMDLELQTKRTQLMEEENNQLHHEIQGLNDRLSKLQSECDHHEKVALDAQEQLQLQRKERTDHETVALQMAQEALRLAEQDLESLQASYATLKTQCDAMHVEHDKQTSRISELEDERCILSMEKAEWEANHQQSTAAQETLLARILALEDQLKIFQAEQDKALVTHAGQCKELENLASQLQKMKDQNALLSASNHKLNVEVHTLTSQLEALDNAKSTHAEFQTQLKLRDSKISELEDEVIHLKTIHSRHQQRSASIEEERDLLKTSELEVQLELIKAQNSLCRQQEYCSALEDELNTLRQENECLLSELQAAQEALATEQEERLEMQCQEEQDDDEEAKSSSITQDSVKLAKLQQELKLALEERVYLGDELALLQKEYRKMEANLNERLEALVKENEVLRRAEAERIDAAQKYKAAQQELQTVRANARQQHEKAFAGVQEKDRLEDELHAMKEELQQQKLAARQQQLHIQTVESERDHAKEELQVARDEIQKQRESLKESQALADTEAGRCEQLVAELHELKQQLASSEQQCRSLRQEKEQLMELQTQLQDALAQQRSNASQARHQLATLEQEKQKLSADTETFKADAEGLRHTLALVQQRHTILAGDKEALATTLMEQDDRIAQLTAAVASAEKRLAHLKGERDAIEKEFKGCQENLIRCQAALQQNGHSAADLEQQRTFLASQVDDLKKELSQHCSEATKQQARYVSMMQDQEELQAALNEALEEVEHYRTNAEQLEKRANHLREERDRLSECLREKEDDTSTTSHQQAFLTELKSITAERDRVASELTAAQAELSQCRSQVSKLQQQAAALEQTNTRLTSDLQASQQELEQQRALYRRQQQTEVLLNQEKDSLQAELATKSAEADGQRAASAQLQQRLAAMQQEKDKMHAELIEAQDDLIQQRATALRLEKRVTVLSQERDRLLETIAKFEGDNSVISQRHSATNEELRGLRMDRDRLVDEVQRLEQEATAQRAAKMDLQQKCTGVELHRDRLESELRVLQDDQQQNAAALAQAKLNLSSAVREKEMLARRAADLEGDVARLSDANRDLNAQVRHHHHEHSVAIERIQEQEQQMATLQQSLTTTTQEAEMLKERCQTLTEERERLQLALDEQMASAISQVSNGQKLMAEMQATQGERDTALQKLQKLQTEMESLQRANITHDGELKQHCEELQGELQVSTRQVEDLTRQRDNIMHQLEAVVREKEDAITSANELHEAAQKRLQGALDENQRQVAILREQCLKLETEYDIAMRKTRQQQHIMEEKDEEVAALHKKLQLAIEEQEQLRQSLRQNRENASQLTRDLEERDNRIAVLQQGRLAVDNTHQHIVELEGLIEELRQQGLMYEDQIERLTEAQQEDLIHIHRLEGENQQLLEEQQSQDHQLNEMRQQLQKAIQESREHKLRAQTLAVEYETLAEQNSELLQREGHISNAKGALHDQFTSLKAQYEKLEAEHSILLEQLHDTQTALVQMTREKEVLQEQQGQTGTNDVIARLEKDLLDTRGTLSRERANAKKLARELEDSRLEATLLAKSQQQVEALQGELKARSHEIVDLQQRLHDLARLKEEADSKDAAEHFQMRKEVEATAARIEHLEGNLALKEGLILQLQKEKARLIDDYKAIQGHSIRTAEQEREFTALKAKLDDQQSKLEDMHRIYDRQIIDLTKKYTAEIQELKQQFLAAKEESQRLARELEKSTISGYEAKVTSNGMEGLQATFEHEATMRKQMEAECTRLRSKVETLTKALDDTRARLAIRAPKGASSKLALPGSPEDDPSLDCPRCVQHGVITPTTPNSPSQASSHCDPTSDKEDDFARRRPWR